MRTEYKRDMNHNYLILTGDERIDTDSYQVRMIVANAVPDLLQCRIQGIDGKFMVYYDITSRHSMTALFEEKKMDLESLQVILGGFIQIMEEMSEYLLNPCQLILEPEYIYLDAERKSVRFCYLPGFHGEIQKQFQSLAEYILPKLDHEDGKAVMLGYNVYRRALEDSFHLEYIKEELYKICNSDEEDFSPYEKKKTVVQEENRMTEEEKAEDLWQVEGWERASVSGNEKQKKSSADSQKRKTNKIWKPVAGFGAALVFLLGITAGMAGGYIPRISKEIFLLGIFAAMILGMLSYILIKKVCGKKKKLDTPVPEKKYGAAEKEAAVYSEDQKESGTLSGSNAGDSRKELEKIKKNIPTKAEDFLDGFGETVVLSAGASKGPATLVSREPGELATIYLEKDITVIGKLETAADAVINIPTVSRIHAKIRKREGAYYLADLNSRNGTSVNGQLLKTGEDYLLEDEDEVDFAQARYIFLK